MRCLLSSAIYPLVLGGCGSPDPNFDVTLGEIRSELTIHVRVLGTRDPVQPRRLMVELDPGVSAGLRHEALCPIPRASATVNGLPLGLGNDGEWTGSQCGDIWYERELETELPSELNQSSNRVELRDDSGEAIVEGDNFINAPTASIVSPEGGRMLPGQRVEFHISPDSVQLPLEIDIYYHADTPSLSFGMEFIEATGTGFAAKAAESAQPSSGRITIEGQGFGNPFRMTPSRCEGAKQCSIERGLCGEAMQCRHGIAYGPGFDVLEVPASVVAAPP